MSTTKAPLKIHYKHVQGGGVPGGHNVIYDGVRKPFITPMKECASIPLRHSDVVVDIGAYVGTYALRCARFPVKQVIAYEPTPQTFSILSLSALPNMKLVNAAVIGGDQPSVNLYISSGIGVTNSVVLSNRKAGKVTVPAVNYREAVADASIVKIDVEGAEYTYDLIQSQIRALIIDFHPVPGNWIKRAVEMIAEIENAGFVSVVKPDFSNGWTRAGSWIRERETSGEYEPMMRGDICCGCGKAIHATRKALCASCYDTWSPAHRAGYDYSE